MIEQANILALTGGVGGAKLALGLARSLSPKQLTIVANTADDFFHLGFPVSPDLDTVMYTLAGLNNVEQGWGLANETWQFMDAMSKLGGDTWFRLGDRDLATHTRRRQYLEQGLSLEQVTAKLCQALGVEQQLIPMTNDAVATQVLTDQGWLDFQDYFVGQQCQPPVSEIRFNGMALAAPSEAFEAAIAAEPKAIIICPSNPFVSVDPILKIPSVLPKLKRCRAPIIAVSPIVNGVAIKGPTAKMMQGLEMPISVIGVASYYSDTIDGLVIDRSDTDRAAEIEAMGIRVKIADTVMHSEQDKINLAQQCLQFAEQFDSSALE